MKKTKAVSIVLTWVFLVCIVSVFLGCEGEKGPAGSTSVIAGITMVSIPAGSFRMGDIQGGGESDEKPVHTVTLSGFEMSAYEITQGQYKAVIGSNPSHFTGDNNLPVEQVSWYDAVKFCNRLSGRAGLDRCYDESTWECDF